MILLYRWWATLQKRNAFFNFLNNKLLLNGILRSKIQCFQLQRRNSLTWSFQRSTCDVAQLHCETCSNSFHVFLLQFTPPWQVNMSGSCSIGSFTFDTRPDRSYPQKNKILIKFMFLPNLYRGIWIFSTPLSSPPVQSNYHIYKYKLNKFLSRWLPVYRWHFLSAHAD